ncbi:MAG: glucose-6-phosphate isomerase [Acidobacteriota bacterium]
MGQTPGYGTFADRAVVLDDPPLLLDLQGIDVDGTEAQRLLPALERAFEEMRALEAGGIANPDEGRRVGHYWLRAPDLAPDPELRQAIERTIDEVRRFAAAVHDGSIAPRPGTRFSDVLHIGIGGSALGPQLVADALGTPDDPLGIRFLDNTDPEGIERTFSELGDRLETTLVVVVSKSGGTPETRNGMEEAIARLRARGLDPAAHLVAVTGEGSGLWRRAEEQRFAGRFPMWDWVGGRTSVTSAVGLLPMALCGHDAAAFLDGARAMDAATRVPDPYANPAARLAVAWHVAGEGRGARDMVVIPYRDRLGLFARYLQQLVMESLGKERDRDGRIVHQGLSVYGNKGSTDQHAYVQQLRDGLDNFFALLVGTLEDRLVGPPLEVEPGVTSGDFLAGFLLGTRRALLERGRRVITLWLPRTDARALGALIALFERTVGLYASLVNVNAYHQPGVEAGKRAAAEVLSLQRALLDALSGEEGALRTAPEWAERTGHAGLAVEAFWVLERLAADPRRPVRREGPSDPARARYGFVS